MQCARHGVFDLKKMRLKPARTCKVPHENGFIPYVPEKKSLRTRTARYRIHFRYNPKHRESVRERRRATKYAGLCEGHNQKQRCHEKQIKTNKNSRHPVPPCDSCLLWRSTCVLWSMNKVRPSGKTFASHPGGRSSPPPLP